MPHPEIINLRGFGYESLIAGDPAGALMFVPLLQATFSIGTDGAVQWADEQTAPVLAGRHYGDPESTSIQWEPQIAFRKLATDIVLQGFAYPSSPGANVGQVGIRVGSIQKLARVFGNRWIARSLGRTILTAPLPFERIPLIYERCFGGWDRRHQDPDRHRCEPRNPVGVGYYDDSLTPEDGLPVPNIEDPADPYRGYGHAPPPAGFGFIGANWQPRVRFAGTYDELWDKTRKPLLPVDFDLRFFNAGSPSLISSGYLCGDEEVVVIGAVPKGRIAFKLPGIFPPICVVELRARRRVEVHTALDTVVVDAEQARLTLMWRGHLALQGGVHDVVSVEVRTADCFKENVDVVRVAS